MEVPEYINEVRLFVSKEYDIPESEISGHKRVRDIVKARFITVYLIKVITGLQFKVISQNLFDSNDHYRSRYAFSELKNMMIVDQSLKQEIDLIKQKALKVLPKW